MANLMNTAQQRLSLGSSNPAFGSFGQQQQQNFYGSGALGGMAQMGQDTMMQTGQGTMMQTGPGTMFQTGHGMMMQTGQGMMMQTNQGMMAQPQQSFQQQSGVSPLQSHAFTVNEEPNFESFFKETEMFGCKVSVSPVLLALPLLSSPPSSHIAPHSSLLTPRSSLLAS